MAIGAASKPPRHFASVLSACCCVLGFSVFALQRLSSCRRACPVCVCQEEPAKPKAAGI